MGFRNVAIQKNTCDTPCPSFPNLPFPVAIDCSSELLLAHAFWTPIFALMPRSVYQQTLAALPWNYIENILYTVISWSQLLPHLACISAEPFNHFSASALERHCRPGPSPRSSQSAPFKRRTGRSLLCFRPSDEVPSTGPSLCPPLPHSSPCSSSCCSFKISSTTHHPRAIAPAPYHLVFRPPQLHVVTLLPDLCSDATFVHRPSWLVSSSHPRPTPALLLLFSVLLPLCSHRTYHLCANKFIAPPTHKKVSPALWWRELVFTATLQYLE